MNTRDVFSKNFSALFESAGITQIDFAKAIGVSRGLVSLWLHGRSFPRADMLEKIAQYFRIPVSDLVYLKGESTADDSEEVLLALYRQLGPAGQRIAIERVQELVYIYGKKDTQDPAQRNSAESD